MSSKEPLYIRNFKEATKREPSEKDLEELESEMYGVSDRTAVITLVAYLEWVFSRYIQSCMRPTLNSDEKKALFDYNGPLGTFSSQIAVAYGLGLMGKVTRDDMELLRVIRNGAAHSTRAFSFEAPETIAICRALKLPDAEQKVFSTAYIKSVTGDDVKVGTQFADDSAKTRFNCSVHTISLSVIRPVDPKMVAMVIPYHLP